MAPGGTLALLPGYNTETASVGIENLTFSGDASNTGIALTLSTGIMAITLIGSAPIAVTGNESANSITGNDGSNVVFGGLGNDSINGGAGADTIYYVVGEGDMRWTAGNPAGGAFPADAQPPGPPPPPEPFPGDGIDTIDGGGRSRHAEKFSGTPQYFDDWGKGYGGDNYLNVVVVDGAIASIAGGTVANVESVVLDLGEGEYWPDVDALDYAGTTEAVTVNLGTGTGTGFTSIAGVENVLGGSGNDVLTGDAGPNSLAGGAGLDTLTGGDGFDNLHGGDGADVLDGGAGDDQLKGGIGFDTLTGGTGIDRFEGALSELNGDRITDYETGERIFLEGSLSGAGNVRLVATGADTELQIDGDNDGSFETVMTLSGTISGTIILNNTGDPYPYYTNNVIRIVTPNAATPGNDLLVGTPAVDTIDGLAGDDEIFGLAGNDTLIGGTGTDTLYGSDGNDDLSGGADRDYLYGDSGADTLEGGDGYDVLMGGDGDDVLTDSGTDDFSAHMDGGAGNDILLDNAGLAVLWGSAGNDILIGGLGEDYLYGGDGNDTFVLGSTADFIEFARDQIRDWETSDIIDLAGIDANTSISGNQDFSFLGLGAADLTVGQGQVKYYQDGGTTYLVGNATADNQADFVIQINGLHNLTADQILGLANAVLTGTSDDDILIGTSGNDILTGGEGDDLLEGRAGGDAMTGGAGNDVYVVDNVGDVVIERATEGIDTVNASVHYRLTSDVEHLVLLGSSNLQAYGNELSNSISGNSGSNILNGDAGADVMYGLAGDDAYFVDNAGDGVIENANEGSDVVFSTAHLRLSANVETLVLQGNADLQGYGNGLTNALYGNGGNNLLNGNGGADAMLGGIGNDVYFVDDAGDQVVENAGEGQDAVFSTAHFGLSANVETLVLQGNADLQGYGNSLTNKLYGNGGNNLLNGNGGADTMLGGIGNDVYFVDDAGDLVFENLDEGTDAVFATVTHTLSANVETLVLQGSGGLNGTGNGLDNKVFAIPATTYSTVKAVPTCSPGKPATTPSCFAWDKAMEQSSTSPAMAWRQGIRCGSSDTAQARPLPRTTPRTGRSTSTAAPRTRS